MYIVWGTKVVNRKLGRAADFCPLCRDVRPFRVRAIETVGHLYYIPLGKRTLQGWAKTCDVCTLERNSSVGEYQNFSKRRDDDIQTLIEETNPEVAEKWKERLELEKRVQTRSITPEERARLIREPFALLNAQVNGSLDLLTTVLVLLAIVIPIILGIALGSNRVTSEDNALFIALGLAAALFAVAIAVGMTSTRRRARKVLVPRIARSLRTIDPSLDELEATLQKLKGEGAAVAKKVTAADVYDTLHLPDL